MCKLWNISLHSHITIYMIVRKICETVIFYIKQIQHMNLGLF